MRISVIETCLVVLESETFGKSKYEVIRRSEKQTSPEKAEVQTKF